MAHREAHLPRLMSCSPILVTPSAFSVLMVENTDVRSLRVDAFLIKLLIKKIKKNKLVSMVVFQIIQ